MQEKVIFDDLFDDMVNMELVFFCFCLGTKMMLNETGFDDNLSLKISFCASHTKPDTVDNQKFELN